MDRCPKIHAVHSKSEMSTLSTDFCWKKSEVNIIIEKPSYIGKSYSKYGWIRLKLRRTGSGDKKKL